jgi:hypothetical protein
MYLKFARSWDRILNSVSASWYYIVHAIHFSFIFFQLIISSKSSLLLLQEFPTESVFFNRYRADPYSSFSSHQYYNFFLFGLLVFVIKLKYNNSIVYRSYCRDENVVDQCVSRRSNLLNNSTGVGYDIRVACTFVANEKINLHDLWIWFKAAP